MACHLMQCGARVHLRLCSEVSQGKERAMVMVNGSSVRGADSFDSAFCCPVSLRFLLLQNCTKISTCEAVTGYFNIQERRASAGGSSAAHTSPHWVRSDTVNISISFLIDGQWKESLSVVAFEPKSVSSPLAHLSVGAQQRSDKIYEKCYSND